MHDDGRDQEELKPSSSDPFYLLDPRDPAPGVLAVLARASRMDEIGQLERSGITRIWRVRGIVSDGAALSRDPEDAINRPLHNLLHLNENPLSIYLHLGGHKAVYYDLIAEKGRQLSYIEVQVETRLPSNAITLARRPLNALLDVLTRDSNMPLTLQSRVDIARRRSTPSVPNAASDTKWSVARATRRNKPGRALRALRRDL